MRIARAHSARRGQTTTVALAALAKFLLPRKGRANEMVDKAGRAQQCQLLGVKRTWQPQTL
jgi:hypothetical protein